MRGAVRQAARTGSRASQPSSCPHVLPPPTLALINPTRRQPTPAVPTVCAPTLHSPSPRRLSDLVGADVGLHVGMNIMESFPERCYPARIIQVGVKVFAACICLSCSCCVRAPHAGERRRREGAARMRAGRARNCICCSVPSPPLMLVLLRPKSLALQLLNERKTLGEKTGSGFYK